jgi:hypothetical protein
MNDLSTCLLTLYYHDHSIHDLPCSLMITQAALLFTPNESQQQTPPLPFTALTVLATTKDPELTRAPKHQICIFIKAVVGAGELKEAVCEMLGVDVENEEELQVVLKSEEV